MIGRCQKVSVSWCKLVVNKRAIAEVRPSCVPIVPLLDLGESCLRPRSSRRVGRHPPQPRRPGDLEDAPGVLMDGEAGDDTTDDNRSEDDAGEIDQPDQELLDLLDEVADFAFASAGAGGAAAGVGEPPVVDGPGSADAGDTGEVAPAAPPLAGDAPPPPPPAADQPAGVRGAATVTFLCPGGSVSFYPSKGSFQAICEHPGHNRCVLTRTCKSHGFTPDGLPKGGRPIGFLVAWLAAGETMGTKAEHWSPAALRQDAGARAAMRRAVAESGVAGRLLLSCERPAVDGEPAEPPTLHGYAG